MPEPALTTPALRPAQDRDGYMPQLDGLRALAVAMVINHHFMPHPDKWRFAGRLFVDKFESSGVRLFFVLSGFLITGILLARRTDAAGASLGDSLKQFYVRRFLRIMPLFYAVLIAMYAMDLPYVRETIGWHAAYLSNVYYSIQGISGDGPCSHFWSLAVEEQFYLAWPLLILVIPRRFLLPVISVAFAAGVLFRLAGCIRAQILFGMYHNPVETAYLPLAALDSLAIGAMLALAASPDFGSAKLRRLIERVGFFCGLPIAVGGILMTQVTWDYTWMITLFDAGMALFYAAVVSRAAAGVGGPLGAALGKGPMAYIGKISYGLYVYHLPVFWALQMIPFAELGSYRHTVVYAISVAATFVIASLSFYLFERPINNLKRYFPYGVRRGNDSAGDAQDKQLAGALAGSQT